MPQKIRPGDLLRSPVGSGKKKKASEADIPDSWRTRMSKVEEWPFVDPDVMLETQDESFADFPNDESELPEGVVPFSEFEPWGRMEEETDRDYELFSHYRSLGLGRTYSETARAHGISPTYVSNRAKKHDWDDRVRAWDEYREQIYTSTVIEKIRDMADEHASIANKGIKAMAVVFEELLERGDDPELKAELKEMSARGVFNLAEKAARVIPNLMNAERLSRGMPTELTAEVRINENRVTVQTTDELAQILSDLQNALDVGDQDGVIDAEVVE